MQTCRDLSLEMLNAQSLKDVNWRIQHNVSHYHTLYTMRFMRNPSLNIILEVPLDTPLAIVEALLEEYEG